MRRNLSGQVFEHGRNNWLDPRALHRNQPPPNPGNEGNGPDFQNQQDTQLNPPAHVLRRRSSQDQINSITKVARLADIQFNGDVKKINPIWFIEQIEAIGEGELVEEEALKKVFRTAMKGSAANWIQQTCLLIQVHMMN